MTDISQTILSTLKGFGVEAELAEVQSGAAVDRYALRLAAGTRAADVEKLAKEIAMATGQRDVRVLAPIPGTSYVGVEVPAAERGTIALEDLQADLEQDHPLRFPVGVTVGGQGVSARLDKLPHLLVAGTTGSGKSVFLTAVLAHLVTHADPADLQLVLVDPKRVELAPFAGLPHLARPVATTVMAGIDSIDAVVAEVDRRYELLQHAGKRKIDELADKPPYLVLAVEELADLIMTGGKRVEDGLVRILQIGRAAGVHVILATQRPSADVIKPLIKANTPSRMVFAVQSHVDSGVALGQTGAQTLLGQGDGLWWPSGASQPERVQAAYLSTEALDDLLAPMKRDAVETPAERDARVREGMFAGLRETNARAAAAPSSPTPVTAPSPEEPLEADDYTEMQGRINETAARIAETRARIAETRETLQHIDVAMEAAYRKGREHAAALDPPMTPRRLAMPADYWVAILVGLLTVVGSVLVFPVLPIVAGVAGGWYALRRRTTIHYNRRNS